jgi:hypothetical protein
MRNVSDKSRRENQHTYLMFSNFFRLSFRFRDNVKKCCRSGQATNNTIGRMRFAYRIHKAKNTRSEYVIVILFPQQQRLHIRGLMLRNTYIVYLVRFTGIGGPSSNKQFRTLANLTVRWCERTYRPLLFVYVNFVVFSLCWFCDWSLCC